MRSERPADNRTGWRDGGRFGLVGRGADAETGAGRARGQAPEDRPGARR